MPTMAESRAVDRGVKQTARELRRELAALYGSRLLRLILFGSQARGDAQPWSDIDVMAVLAGSVDPEQEARRTIDIVARLSLDHNCVIVPEFVGEAEFTRSGTGLVDTVREEGLEMTDRQSSLLRRAEKALA